MNTKTQLTALSLLAVISFSRLKIQPPRPNILAFNTASEIKPENHINAPVIKQGTSSFDAAKASRNGNLAVIIHHGEDDPISGLRYAKGFVIGFASSEKTNNKPIYITAIYKDKAYEGPTFVEVFMDGKKWDYQENFQFSPYDVGRLAPIIMNEFVKVNGSSKILSVQTAPVRDFN